MKEEIEKLELQLTNLNEKFESIVDNSLLINNFNEFRAKFRVQIETYHKLNNSIKNYPILIRDIESFQRLCDDENVNRKPTYRLKKLKKEKDSTNFEESNNSLKILESELWQEIQTLESLIIDDYGVEYSEWFPIIISLDSNAFKSAFKDCLKRKGIDVRYNISSSRYALQDRNR